jgi:hypothetical protein
MHPNSRALLAWMGSHPERLRELLELELEHADGDTAPMGDASIRAHLRFVGEALSAHAAPGDDGLAGFGGRLPALLGEREHLYAEQLAALGEAHAFEAGKQFGDVAQEDPSNQQVIERRVRMGAWLRVFLDALDSVRDAAPVSGRVNEWMAARQTDLANLIFTMDRQAKEAERARGGEQAIADPDAVNRIGQAATVRAHSRFLVEALGEALD